MSPDLTTVLTAAESLPVAERRELIDLLLQGLDDPTPAGAENGAPSLSEAWLHEVAQRSAEYDAGQAQTISFEELQARWLERRASGG